MREILEKLDECLAGETVVANERLVLVLLALLLAKEENNLEDKKAVSAELEEAICCVMEMLPKKVLNRVGEVSRDMLKVLHSAK